MQLDQEFIKWLIAQAIGLVLATIIFQAYRLLAVRLETMNDRMMTIIGDNTASNTKLITLIEAQERNMLRMADVERMIVQKMAERKNG